MKLSKKQKLMNILKKDNLVMDTPLQSNDKELTFV